MMALQEERGSTSYSELQKEATQRDLTQATESQAPVLTWSRLPGQVNFFFFFFSDKNDGKKNIVVACLNVQVMQLHRWKSLRDTLTERV